MRAIGKLHISLGIPLLFLLIAITWMGPKEYYPRYYNTNEYRLLYFSFIIIYFFIHMKCLTWFCCGIGLKVKTHRKAIMIGFVSMALWVILPLVPIMLFSLFYAQPPEFVLKSIAFFSPVIPFVVMFDSPSKFEIVAFAISTCIIFVLYIFFRIHCMNNAEKYLRR